MEEKVSEGEENNGIGTSSESRVMCAWEDLERTTDHLNYYCNAYDSATDSLKKYRHWLVESREEDVDIIEKLVSQSMEFGKKFGQVGPVMERRTGELIEWLTKKIGWRPNKEVNNVGYAGYEDMLLRYKDLRKELGSMKRINQRMYDVMSEVEQEHVNFCQMNEKIEELRFRSTLLHVSQVISSRTMEHDPLESFFRLPILLVGLIFHPETSNPYAALLLRACKRILVIAEAIQYERDSKNSPVVTLSNILSHHSLKPSVTSLYVQVAEGNGEVPAPCENTLPIAKDSAHCLMGSTPKKEVIMSNGLVANTKDETKAALEVPAKTESK